MMLFCLKTGKTGKRKVDKKGRERREGRGIKREKNKGKNQERLTTDWVYSRNSCQLTFELRAMPLLVT